MYHHKTKIYLKYFDYQQLFILKLELNFLPEMQS